MTNVDDGISKSRSVEPPSPFGPSENSSAVPLLLFATVAAFVTGIAGYLFGLRRGRREGLHAARDDDEPMPSWMVKILQEDGEL